LVFSLREAEEVSGEGGVPEVVPQQLPLVHPQLPVLLRQPVEPQLSQQVRVVVPVGRPALRQAPEAPRPSISQEPGFPS
jgi:hypothetical protein